MLLLLSFLCACSSGNSIVIAKQSGKSSLHLTDNSLYIDPALLGMPQGSDITVHTGQDNEMTFNADLPREKESYTPYDEGKAF